MNTIYEPSNICMIRTPLLSVEFFNNYIFGNFCCVTYAFSLYIFRNFKEMI